CGSSGGRAAFPPMQCYSQLSGPQIAALQQYLAQHPGTATTTKGSKVCVLQPNGSGGYIAHYFGPTDGFPNYALYAAMNGATTNVATYGKIQGKMTPVEQIGLRDLRVVGSDGAISQPYTTKGGTFVRTNTALKTVKVTSARFGQS